MAWTVDCSVCKSVNHDSFRGLQRLGNATEQGSFRDASRGVNCLWLIFNFSTLELAKEFYDLAWCVKGASVYEPTKVEISALVESR